VATKKNDGPDGPETPAGAIPPRRTGSAFLLAQLGAHGAAQFAQRISELDLTPPQAGLLRLIAWNPGQSQQAIAGKLGTLASSELRPAGLYSSWMDSKNAG
jgi:hypothetical protein